VITSATFGEGGRLGNQLFQLGLLVAVAARTGHRFGLRRRGEQIWGCFDLDVPDFSGAITNTFREPPGSCNFDPRAFSQPDGTAFEGYYQTWRYYEHCRPQLTSFLKFQRRVQDVARLEIARIRSAHERPLVSVHYRRADYLDPPVLKAWGNLHDDGYYDRAFDRLGDDVVYVVFSDDLPWCRENVRRRRVELADFDPFVSLCMMTLCDANVIANSSYSWWGAFLNQVGGTAYTPSRWIKRMAPGDCPGMAPPEWVRIESFRAPPGP
jgi:hypothetical protein